MAHLIDTNILLRQAQPSHQLHPVVLAAVAHLRAAGEALYVACRNPVEFRCVATRPVSVNGLGMAPDETDRELDRLERLFLRIPDGPAVYPEWRRLVAGHSVSGVKVHDARLVAVMHVHGISHVLTLNAGDFLRYHDITVVRPQDLVPAQ